MDTAIAVETLQQLEVVQREMAATLDKERSEIVAEAARFTQSVGTAQAAHQAIEGQDYACMSGFPFRLQIKAAMADYAAHKARLEAFTVRAERYAKLSNAANLFRADLIVHGKLIVARDELEQQKALATTRPGGMTALEAARYVEQGEFIIAEFKALHAKMDAYIALSDEP